MLSTARCARYFQATNSYVLRADSQGCLPYLCDFQRMTQYKKRKKEMTLDRIFTHTTKGHFCSLLVSNIFWLSSLSLSAYATYQPTTLNTHHIISFSSENYFILGCTFTLQEAKCLGLTVSHFQSD